MTPSPLKIIIDRLKKEGEEKIEETFSPAVIDIQDEKDIFFPKEISIVGKAYLANDHLIIQLKIKTTILMPCSICNEYIEFPICVNDFSDARELAEISSSIYDFTEEVRSALLLKIPHYTECNEGNCTERKEIQKYITSGNTKKMHSPFAETF